MQTETPSPLSTLPDTQMTRLLRWRQGETPGPWWVSIQPTNRCNLMCKHCWRIGALEERGDEIYANELTDDRLLRLIDEGAEIGVREWTIVGGGEPMVRGKVVMAMCERIRELGMNGTLHTNGMLLREPDCRRLVEIGWERISVSLDGIDAETTNYIRGAKCYERATECLGRIRDLRKEYETEFPKTGICFVVTRTNYTQLSDFVHMAAEFDCAYGAAFAGLLVQHDGSARLALSGEQQAELPQSIAAALATARELGVMTSLGDLEPETGRTVTGNIPPEARGEVPPKFPDGGIEGLGQANCFEAWTALSIQPTGQVGPCCVSGDLHADSIENMSLRDAWLGPYMTETRESLISKTKVPHYCSQCPSYIVGSLPQMRSEYGRLEAVRPWESGSRMRLAGYLLGRLRENLRTRGPGETVRRAWQWMQIHGRAVF